MSIGVLTRSRIYKKNYQKEHKKVIVVSAIEKSFKSYKKDCRKFRSKRSGKTQVHEKFVL